MFIMAKIINKNRELKRIGEIYPVYLTAEMDCNLYSVYKKNSFRERAVKIWTQNSDSSSIYHLNLGCGNHGDISPPKASRRLSGRFENLGSLLVWKSNPPPPSPRLELQNLPTSFIEIKVWIQNGFIKHFRNHRQSFFYIFILLKEKKNLDLGAKLKNLSTATDS